MLERRCGVLQGQLLSLQPISTWQEDGLLSVNPQIGCHSLTGVGAGLLCTFGLPQMRLTSDRWYYEVEIQADLEGAPLQIGWANSAFALPSDQSELEPQQQRGVGDCSNSWGFDGSRGLRFHNHEDDPALPNAGTLGPRRWKRGDVVSVILELPDKPGEQGHLSCLVNNTARVNGDFTIEYADVGDGMFPAVSFALAPPSQPQGVACRYESRLNVNFGQKPFRFNTSLHGVGLYYRRPVADAPLRDCLHEATSHSEMEGGSESDSDEF